MSMTQCAISILLFSLNPSTFIVIALVGVATSSRDIIGAQHSVTSVTLKLCGNQIGFFSL